MRTLSLQPLDVERGESNPPQTNTREDNIVLVSRKEFKRPTFRANRKPAEPCREFPMEDTQPPSPSPSSISQTRILETRRRKRTSTDLPATTIKLGTTKRSMLLCRKPAREARATSGKDDTGFTESERPKRQKVVVRTVIIQGVRDEPTFQDEDPRGNAVAALPKPKASSTDMSTTSNGTEGSTQERQKNNRDEDGGLICGEDEGESHVDVFRTKSDLESLSKSPAHPLSPRIASSRRGVSRTNKSQSRGELVAEKRKEKASKRGQRRDGRGAGGLEVETRIALLAGTGSLEQAPAFPSEHGLPTHKLPAVSLSGPQPPLRKKIEHASRAGKLEATEPAVEDPKKLGPWSTEALDLFEWRPPHMG